MRSANGLHWARSVNEIWGMDKGFETRLSIIHTYTNMIYHQELTAEPLQKDAPLKMMRTAPRIIDFEPVWCELW